MLLVKSLPLIHMQTMSNGLRDTLSRYITFSGQSRMPTFLSLMLPMCCLMFAETQQQLLKQRQLRTQQSPVVL